MAPKALPPDPRLCAGVSLCPRRANSTRTGAWISGGLKAVRAWLHEMFDHTVLVAEDDPHLQEFDRLAKLGLMSLRIIPAVGCEAVAHYVFVHVGKMVSADTSGRVWVESVEVREHSGNSAIYQEDRWDSGSSI